MPYHPVLEIYGEDSLNRESQIPKEQGDEMIRTVTAQCGLYLQIENIVK